ncbi:hypothetical protein [Roseomonas populi]|uniref:GAF domain-containing protein n=1 Tax=Roseomonas populi TaxID=3121582 RepID=A0ABT1XBB3_9PROT|nr:hypothetical protein [Roseomonas pecuniae]MCR0985431.1 hypothetical protein [Roseomonas pecuniae]
MSSKTRPCRMSSSVTTTWPRTRATRHPLYRVGRYNAAPKDDLLAAVAVPIVARGRLLGAVTINWNRAALDEAAMIRLHLGKLLRAANGTARDAAELGVLDIFPGEAAEWPVRESGRR